MGKVVPLEELLSERSKVQFQQQAHFGRPWSRTFRFSEDGRGERDLISLSRTGEWPVARLVI